MPIREWKWERIGLDFMVGLPKTLGMFDFIWVVVDILTKLSHFIPIRIEYNTQQLAKVYVRKIVRLHEVPLLSSQIVLRSSPPCFEGSYIRNWAHN